MMLPEKLFLNLESSSTGQIIRVLLLSIYQLSACFYKFG